MIPNRNYVRCTDCLSFGVVEGDYTPGWHCSLCAGTIEHMGKVVEDTRKYETQEERSACDKRCTHAVGPICVCKCNCANHGTGRIVHVTVLRDLPTVQFTDDEQASEAGRSYRLGVQALFQTLTVLRNTARDYSRPYAERRLEGQKAYYGTRVLQKAKDARTWKARNRYLTHINNILTGAVEPWAQVPKH